MKIGTLEMKIARVEGFQVRIRTFEGRDIRSDRMGRSVARWKQDRFVRLHPGFDVEVLDITREGSKASFSLVK